MQKANAGTGRETCHEIIETFCFLRTLGFVAMASYLMHRLPLRRELALEQCEAASHGRNWDLRGDRSKQFGRRFEWSRIYGFADGHCETPDERDANFADWEHQHSVAMNR